jgi:uncharacterized protein (TIGR02596 family)
MVAMTSRFSGKTHGAFTLLELLAVLTIIIILMAVTGPAVLSSMGGSNINRAGQLIGDKIALARQEALTRNREVQVRFFHWTAGQQTGWRAIQVWRVETTDSQSTLVPVSRLERLPDGIVISELGSLSPLLSADPQVAGTTNISGSAVSYAGFRFLPNGGATDSISSTNNFVTVQSATESGPQPKNFYTLQVHPLTGKISVFRP